MKHSDFFIQDEFCEFVKKLSKFEFSCRNSGLKNELYSTDHLLECSRRIYYRSIEVENDSLSMPEIQVKRKWVSLFSNSDNDIVKIIDSNCRLSDMETHLTGVADAILHFPIKEIKTIGTFLHCKKEEISYIKEYGPYRRHIMNQQALMYLLDMANSFIIYDDYENNVEIFNINENKSLQNFIVNKIKNIKNSSISGYKPDRDYENNNSKECKICAFREKCWR